MSKEDIRWTLYFLKVAGSKINILEGISIDKRYWYQISNRLIGRILMTFKKIKTTASYRPSNSDTKTVEVNPRGWEQILYFIQRFGFPDVVTPQ